MKTRKQVPQIKQPFKPIRPKPQVLNDSKEKNPSCFTTVNSLNIFPCVQNSELLVKCYGNNNLMPCSDKSKHKKMPDATKNENCNDIRSWFSSSDCATSVTVYNSYPKDVAFVSDPNIINVPDKNKIIDAVTPNVNVKNKTSINFKEEKSKNNSITFNSSRSNCRKRQFHSAQSSTAISEGPAKHNFSKHNLKNLCPKKLSSAEVKREGSLHNKHLKPALLKEKTRHNVEFINNKPPVMLTENSDNTLKKRESAILKTFAKIAPASIAVCSTASTNKGRNFFTIRRNGKKSLVVCRNVKERKLQFLPADYCNDDRCCPTILSEVGVQNILEELEKKPKSSEDNASAFVNSFNEHNIHSTNADNCIQSEQHESNSCLEIIDQTKQADKKNNSEIISVYKNSENNNASKKNSVPQFCSEDEFNLNSSPEAVDGSSGMKLEIPAVVTDCSLNPSNRKTEATANITVDKPITNEANENSKGCSFIKPVATTGQKVKSNLDVSLAFTKPVLCLNQTAASQINEILKKYPKIAPRLSSVQDQSQANFDIRKNNCIVYQPSPSYHETLLENGRHSIPIFKRIINGNIKTNQDIQPSGVGNRNESVDCDENNTKKIKISTDACNQEMQTEEVMSNDSSKSFSEDSKSCCNVSQCVEEIDTIKCNSESNCNSEIVTCCTPKITEICLPVLCSNPTDNIDVKVLSFTELTDLSQKLGKEIFHSLSLDEITEKAILEWTEPGKNYSTDLSSYSEDDNQIDVNSETTGANCCITSHSLHQWSLKTDQCCLNLPEITTGVQQQQLKSINFRANNKEDTLQTAEGEIAHKRENPTVNNISKVEFLSHLNLHQSDNVFGIPVPHSRMLQEIEPDYAKNPCVPLNRIIKTSKFLKQNCAKSRNCNKIDPLLSTIVAPPLSTDLYNEKAFLVSMHKMNDIEPVSESTKGKCLVISSDSRHIGGCLLIPVQAMLTSTGNPVTNVESSKCFSPVLCNRAFTAQNRFSSSFNTNSLQIEKKSPLLIKKKTNQLPYSLHKPGLATCKTFSPIIRTKHTDTVRSIHVERARKTSSGRLQSQRNVPGSRLKIPRYNVITHCCTSSHHSSFCCNANNRYHSLTRLC